MANITIGELARRAGLRASAIRYYEKIGLLPKTQRVGGQRHYEPGVLNYLAVIDVAKRVGFRVDEMQHLRDNHSLRQLLTCYTAPEAADTEGWHDRVMALEGVKPPELTTLHGELLAFGWIEQNTGARVAVRAGTVPRCYRSTPAGRRALREVQADPSEAGAEAEAA